MAESGKFEEGGSDGMNQETSATHNQSPQPNSPGSKPSIKVQQRSNSTDCKYLE